MPVDKDEARLIAETVVAHLKAEGLFGDKTAAAPVKPATKAAAAKTAAAATGKAPTTLKRDDVLAACRAAAKVIGADDARARLQKFAPSVAELDEKDFQAVIDAVNAPADTSESF